MFEKVCIQGITDLECYPKYRDKMCFKQVLEDDMLCLPTKKPNIESINEICINICVKGYKVINTILGPKLIINGIKKVKVIYTSDNCVQSVHSSHWEIPFCEFILMDKLNIDACSIKVGDIFIGIEDIIIKYYNCRVIDISVLFIIIPIILNYPKHKENYYNKDTYSEYVTNKYYHPLSSCNSPEKSHPKYTQINYEPREYDNDVKFYSRDYPEENPQKKPPYKNKTFKNKFRKSALNKKKR